MDLDCLEEWVVPWRRTVGSLPPIVSFISKSCFSVLATLFASFIISVGLLSVCIKINTSARFGNWRASSLGPEAKAWWMR